MISTSTVSFGWMKPATPETSLIRTLAARMPSGSSAAIDAPAPWPEILPGQDRLIDGDRHQRDALLACGHQLPDVGEGAGRNAGVGIVDEADLVRRDVAADKPGGSRYGDLGRARWRKPVC